MLKATEVFTPGAFPLHTYIKRGGKGYEDDLRDALDTSGQIVSLSGPSKSGKTVLVEHVVGNENLITITGAGIEHPDEVWDRVLDWMDVPGEVSHSESNSSEISAGGEAIVKVEGRFDRSSAAARTYRRQGMLQVIKEISSSDFVVLIDDFHYMPREVQEAVAKQIKEAARQGVKIATASVAHRSDDVVRANPELRGRVMAIDLDYWEIPNLREIAVKGFELLKAELNQTSLNDFAEEAAGSPQLMQAICLNACFELNLRTQGVLKQVLSPSKPKRQEILERTAAATNFRSLVDILDSGPKTRGTERKAYKFKDDTDGDVYRCILKAVSSNPPQLSFPYDEILTRIDEICVSEEPVGSSVVGSCLHMSKLAQDKFPKERVIDWDEQKQVLDIPDPYLLFYLRWSGRLMEPEN